MMRVVQADDRRTWTIHSKISWTKPERSEQFEHDMAAAGYLHGIAMLGLVIVLTLFLVFWTPVGVVIPAWFVLFVLLVLLLVLVAWALQRPWVITAHTDQPVETRGEHWEGVVRGVVAAREEIQRVTDDLRTRNVPDDGRGPLSRIASPNVPFGNA
ncbi:MAG: DUF983 domain-containing protein [Pseudonocardiales bacterium]|nr:DUF983 domain-containing protein [Pseudonocardiales bacterium]